MATQPITDQYVASLLHEQAAENIVLALEVAAERDGYVYHQIGYTTVSCHVMGASEPIYIAQELRYLTRAEAVALIARLKGEAS